MAKKSNSGRPSTSRPFKELYVEVPTLKVWVAASRAKVADGSQRLAAAIKTNASVPRRQSDIFDDELSGAKARPSRIGQRFVGPLCRDPARKVAKQIDSRPVSSPRKRQATSRFLEQSGESFPFAVPR